MDQTSNKLPLAVVQRIVNSINVNPRKVRWMNTEFIVKPVLSLQEYMETVTKIVNDCQDDAGSIAVGLIDFSLRTNVIAAYANIELPSDIEELFNLVFRTTLYDTVCSAINSAQLQSIKNTVNLVMR